MSALNRTVLAGGVVYPAGTEATDDLLAKIPNPRLWGEGSDETSVSVNLADFPEVAEAIEQAAERIDELTAALEAKDEEIAALTAQLAAVSTANSDGDATDVGPTPAAPVAPGTEQVEQVDYSALDLDALKAEIDKRNEGRDGDARLSKRGSQETLVAALVADDTTAQG